ncbi:hypothetical protein [Mycobacterium ostraviense]
MPVRVDPQDPSKVLVVAT